MNIIISQPLLHLGRHLEISPPLSGCETGLACPISKCLPPGYKIGKYLLNALQSLGSPSVPNLPKREDFHGW
jgi:hypothetical protein